MKKLLAAAALAAMLVSPVCFAADAPEYNYKAYCKTVAEAGGGSSMIEKGCRDMELEAKQKIESMDVPAKTMKYCRSVAESMGEGSYSTLQGCIDMEMEAAAELD